METSDALAELGIKFQFYISAITILQNAGEWRLCINAIAIAKVMYFCELRCQ